MISMSTSVTAEFVVAMIISVTRVPNVLTVTSVRIVTGCCDYTTKPEVF